MLPAYTELVDVLDGLSNIHSGHVWKHKYFLLKSF